MRTIKQCRSCKGEVVEFLDLGVQATSDFREDDSKTPEYPIVAVICEDCKLVQLRDTTPSAEMYHENYGFKSGVSNSIKDDLKDIVWDTMGHFPEPKSWLDIASNDGTLLSYVPKRVYRVGVDPISKYCKMAEEHADEIVNDFFPSAMFPTRKFDVITSISCFYDMDDPNNFVGSVADVLEGNGIWTIQQNYLLSTMQLNAVDNFCHEHLEYYTLLSLEPLLERHGLEVIDLSTSMVNGGSIRTIVAHKGAHPPQDSVEKQRTIEKDFKLDTLEPYVKFANDVWDNLNELTEFVDEANASSKTVAILAASTRGATIWQACGFDKVDIAFAVERNPEKVGKYFNAIGIPIISEEEARERKPEYMIIGPWFFADEIIKREKEYVNNGGTLIVPLPKLEVINAGNIHTYVR
ncbi:class I SAM-dependent methyltransferase [Candidatus Saccharibacteria bacterium]|nr:class I SAM-dependent methyltransferase [Candidatus Saccharibacteria bacterium]